ncbi:TetR/AcrR family transcriptional regulator [Pseudomonas sp. NPDC096917]|uniref:TetR/AcrR family transcriptional regulator n=1 Tax=Pseudomonas sp. NPDC096917 TaxID=3364483 RepID=UPI00383A0906
MAARLKTSQRIVNTSLELFNQLGERSVSTNHIAAHMEISPGNLYYHFANKQAIIWVLFEEYETLVLGFLHPPEGRVPAISDKRDYLKHLLNAMWRYRFFYRDIEHLLQSDAELAVRYRRFYEQCLRQGQAIYTGFVKAGILDMTPQQIEALTLNAWIILTSWIGFLCTSSENREQLCEQAIRRGIYQLLVLESGFVTDQYRDAVDELIKEFYVPLEQVMDVH